MWAFKTVLKHKNAFNPLLRRKMIPGKLLAYSTLRHEWSLKDVLNHPDDIFPLLKLKMSMKKAEKQIPTDPNWGFCYSILPRISSSFTLIIPLLDNESRDIVCMFYLLTRALDTIEDDTSIATEIKVPIMKAFHRHIYDCDWQFSCGTKEHKVLMDNFHHVSGAFMELNKSYQEILENTVMRMGAGMSNYICKEIETIDDYEDYCHHGSGLVIMGLSRLFHASHSEILFPDSLSNSVGLILHKTDIIIDYLEDINEIPKPRMFWPREIWSKYVNNLEDLKYEENAEKAVQCLNEMVTNALIHIDDCLKYMSQLRNPTIFRFFAIQQVVAIAYLALCYNNIEVFRCGVKARRGLRAQVIYRTKTMSDAYGAVYDFSSILKSKVDMNDPNAETTISRIDAVQKICRDSGSLDNWNSYVVERKPSYNRAFVTFFLLLYFTMSI